MPVKGYVCVTISSELAAKIDSLKDEKTKKRPAVIEKCVDAYLGIKDP